MTSRRILGVDPGLTRCGVGIVDEKPGRKVSAVYWNTLTADKDIELTSRIAKIGNELDELISNYKPQVIALERVFAQANLRSVMGVAQISGVVLFLAAKHGLPVVMHTPSEVKAAVTGSGRAAKAQIGAAIAMILKLDEAPKPADSADALAIAITQSWRGSPNNLAGSSLTKAQKQLAEAQRGSKLRRK